MGHYRAEMVDAKGAQKAHRKYIRETEAEMLAHDQITEDPILDALTYLLESHDRCGRAEVLLSRLRRARRHKTLPSHRSKDNE